MLADFICVMFTSAFLCLNTVIIFVSTLSYNYRSA